mmetsp:Transcript_79236/g.181455  ORF Transcript_79236/g.181455 Transcript_79236/m.181455 type:complete len:108 (+) Transcript_79236:3328-3651(+)
MPPERYQCVFQYVFSGSRSCGPREASERAALGPTAGERRELQQRDHARAFNAAGTPFRRHSPTTTVHGSTPSDSYVLSCRIFGGASETLVMLAKMRMSSGDEEDRQA